jgi:hypothetical protein
MYAARRRDNLQSFDEMKKANQETLDGVNGIFLMHSREGLSKKFPKSLFTGFPAIFKDRRAS